MDVTENLKSKVKDMEKQIKEQKWSEQQETRTLKHQERERGHHQRTKRIVKSEVIIIMDSNSQYIDSKRFWNGHTCKIFRAGQVKSAKNVLLNNDFSNAKIIYIHIGTNDIETCKNIDDTIKEIIDLGLLAKKENPNAEIVISEIPVRKDFLNERRSEVNSRLRVSLPESLEIISHDNLTKDMLYDKKHIKEDSIHHLIRNMKNKLRKILRNDSEDSRKDHQQNKGKKFLSNEEDLFNGKIDCLVEFLTSVKQRGCI